MKNKSKIIVALGLIVTLLFIVPLIIKLLASEKDVMNLIFIQYCTLNPFLASWLGYLAGTNLKKYSYLPVSFAILFPFANWILLKTINFSFFIFTLTYLLISIIFLYIHYLIKNYHAELKKSKNK